jgi:WD40 repeat protein
MDLATRKEVPFNAGSGSMPTTSLAWSRDGTSLAWGQGDGKVCLRGLTGNTRVIFQGHDGPVRRISWSQDNKYLASAGEDRTVRVWDTVKRQAAGPAGIFNLKELSIFRGHHGQVSSLTWSPDGTRLATSSNDGTVKLWAARTGNEPHLLGDESDSSNCVSWNPKGTQLAWGSRVGMITIWDKGETRLTWQGHTNVVQSVTWGPDGKHLASASGDGAVRVWDPASGKEVFHIINENSLHQISWSPDGKYLASGLRGMIKVWDLTTKSEAFTLRGWGATSWSKDGKRLVCCDDMSQKDIQVWELPSGRAGPKLSGHSAWVTSFSWSPDGTRLASASHDKTIKVWDPATGKVDLNLEGHSAEVHSVSWSPDGTRLASGGVQVVKIWDLATAKEVLTLKTHFGSVSSVSWSPDGTRLAVAGESPGGNDPVHALIYDATRGYQLEGLAGPPIPPAR